MSGVGPDSQPKEPRVSARAMPQQPVVKTFPALPLIMLVYLACSVWGMDWGLYSNDREQYLFPPASQWNPQRVAELRGQRVEDDQPRGADVDPNPVEISTTPVVLNHTDEQVAEIYSRYLLYSNQPDEMITFRALREMDPANWKLDPKMYQYGGLFIYPVGGLIKLASLTGLVQIGGLTDYLNAPEEFAKFYIVGRAYVVLWGLLGIWIVYALGKQLGDWRSGALAALLFALLPVVVSLSHESKPHLPGTVLMLWAVLWALKYIESGLVRHRLMLAVSCGLALGMVLSSLWIFVLIPLVELLTRSRMSERLSRILIFGLIAVVVYGLTNPYVVINLFVNPAILASNLGNSTAMYQWGDWAAGLSNAYSLLVAGALIFVVVAGLVMLPALWGWDWRRTLVLALPPAVVFAQFVGFAAGKPGEYGRFAIFPNAVLCILLSAGLFRFLAHKWYQGTFYAIAAATALAWPTLSYLESLHLDSTQADSRYQLAAQLQQLPIPAEGTDAAPAPIGVLRDPAPYGFPPIDFGARRVVLLPKDIANWPEDQTGWPQRLIVPVNGVEGVDVGAILQDGYYTLDNTRNRTVPDDRTPITWANKPLLMLVHPTEE